jgi:hypothetical protein
MEANRKAFEDGRSQAVSPTRFCGDTIKLPDDSDMHPHWMEGFLQYTGTYLEIGRAYYLWNKP